MSTKNRIATIESAPGRKSRLWLIVVGLFALQIAAWVAWLVIAAHNRVAEVPVVTRPAN